MTGARLTLLVLPALAFFACAGEQKPPVTVTSTRDEPPPENKEPPVRGKNAGSREMQDAKKLANNGDLDGAIQRVRDALNKNPELEEAYLLLGSACGMKDDTACEKEAYSGGINRLPGSAALYDEYGLFMLRNGDPEEAVVNLKHANELARELDAKVMADLAYALIFVEKLDDAEKMADRARRLGPTSIEAAMAHGEVLLRRRNGKGAIEAFEAAGRMTTDDEVKRNLVRRLAQSNAIAGNDQKALDLYQSLVEGPEGRDPLLHAQIAGVFLSMNKAKDAVKAMQAAVEIAPRDRKILNLLMQAQERAGDKKAAKATQKRIDSL